MLEGIDAEVTATPINFDADRRAVSTSFRQQIDALATFLEERERAIGLRTRWRNSEERGRFVLAVEAIACNLLVSVIVGASGLAVPRRDSAMYGRGRYASPVFGNHFLAALDVMEHPDVALTSRLSTGYKFAGREGQRTVIAPTARLGDWLPTREAAWEMFRQEEGEVLILKGPKVRGEADLVDYPETSKTKGLRRAVRKLNDRLRAAPLIILPTEGMSLRDTDGEPIDPNRRTVRRIFNNGGWRQGGRLYGAFWEVMSKAERFRRLRIRTAHCQDGELVANVDFDQLFPHLAYVRSRTPAPDGDLYDIWGDGSDRTGWKRIMNALLFADGDLKAWPEGTHGLFREGTTLKSAIAAVHERHPALVPLFGTGIGFQLFFTESSMLMAGLEALAGLGITALPLHDSVIVAVSESEAARDVMSEVYKQHTGEPRAHLSIQLS